MLLNILLSAHIAIETEGLTLQSRQNQRNRKPREGQRIRADCTLRCMHSLSAAIDLCALENWFVNLSVTANCGIKIVLTAGMADLSQFWVLHTAAVAVVAVIRDHPHRRHHCQRFCPLLRIQNTKAVTTAAASHIISNSQQDLHQSWKQRQKH